MAIGLIYRTTLKTFAQYTEQKYHVKTQQKTATFLGLLFGN